MNLALVEAIVVLPGTALVFVPGAILWLVAESGAAPVPAGPTLPRFWFALVLGLSGFALATWTTRLFLTAGRGTPAPWAPPKRLVVRGPYRHVRKPMITGVLLMLGAESLFFGSWHLAGWMLVFFAGNALHFPLVEERALVRRFGDDYRLYQANVPRWIPRWRPWDAVDRRGGTSRAPRSAILDRDHEASGGTMPALNLADCINETCPWSGKPVQADSLTEYGGNVVGLCNPGCRDKFETAVRHFDEVTGSTAREAS